MPEALLKLNDVRRVLVRDFVITAAGDNDIVLTADVVKALRDAAVLTGVSAAGIAEGVRYTGPVRETVATIVAKLKSIPCGVYAPAPSPSSTFVALHPRTYGETHVGWGKTTLTWRVVDHHKVTTTTFTAADIDNIAAAAFNDWRVASGNVLSFLPAPPGTAPDITLTFGNHRLNKDFGQPGGVLGTGGFPDGPERGQLSIDQTEPWSADPASLHRLVLHELGHILGLSHDSENTSVMYPFVVAGAPVDLNSRMALQAIFGWSRPEPPFPNRGTTDSPTLTTTHVTMFNGSETQQLHMGWKGGGTNSQLYTSQLIPGGWSAEEPITNAHSLLGPSLCETPAVNGVSGLMAAWRGVHGDLRLYWSMRLAAGWQSPRPENRFGSTHRPALAFVPWNGTTVMAWKGITDDPRIWISTRQNGAWSDQQAHGGARTDQSPALVAFNNSLFLFWKAVGSADILFSQLENTHAAIWSAPRRVEFTEIETDGAHRRTIGTSEGPAATVRGNRIMLAWKGIPGDARLWFTLFDGQDAFGQSPIDGATTSRGPAICEHDGVLHLLHRASVSDAILHRRL